MSFRTGVRLLGLSEIVSLIRNFYLIVAQVQLSEQICSRDTLTCCLDVKQPTSQQLQRSLTSYGAHFLRRVSPRPADRKYVRKPFLADWMVRLWRIGWSSCGGGGPTCAHTEARRNVSGRRDAVGDCEVVTSASLRSLNCCAASVMELPARDA